MVADWDSTIAFMKFYARWRRVARMGSQLRMGPQLPHLLHKSSRLTPLRSCTDAYGDVLQSCESLYSETVRARAY
jgi:hypothetical protein